MNTEYRPKQAAPREAIPTLLSAWFDTRMEADRTLVSLSAGGIAVLIGLIAAVPDARAEPVLLAAAICAFLLAIGAGVWTFRLNAALIDLCIEDLGAVGDSDESRRLGQLWWALVLFFAAGVLLSVGVAYGAAAAGEAADSPRAVEALHDGQSHPDARLAD